MPQLPKSAYQDVRGERGTAWDYFTSDQMQDHGHACYAKGRADERERCIRMLKAQGLDPGFTGRMVAAMGEY